jgi:hypothetical protein
MPSAMLQISAEGGTSANAALTCPTQLGTHECNHISLGSNVVSGRRYP